MRASRRSALSSSRHGVGVEEGKGREGKGWDGRGGEGKGAEKARKGRGALGFGNSRIPVVLGHDAETRHMVQIAPVDIFPH